MILTVAEAGPLKTAIQNVMTTTGDEVRTARADDPDLFMRHVVPPRVSTVLRRISGWLGFEQPDVTALCLGTTASAA